MNRAHRHRAAAKAASQEVPTVLIIAAAAVGAWIIVLAPLVLF